MQCKVYANNAGIGAADIEKRIIAIALFCRMLIAQCVRMDVIPSLYYSLHLNTMFMRIAGFMHVKTAVVQGTRTV